MQIQLYISHREGSVKNLNFSQAFHLPAIQNEGDFFCVAPIRSTHKDTFVNGGI